MYKLPSLTRLFGHSQPARPAAAQAFTHKVEPAEVWVNDAQLRLLAKDCDDGITKWVAASDMKEFFKNLDAYNSGRRPEETIHLELLKQVSERFTTWRASGWHDESRNPYLRGKGPIVLDSAESIIRTIGPQEIGGLRLRMGSVTTPACYSANPIDTKLKIQTPSGEWKSFYFGSDTAGSVFPARREISCTP